MRQLDDDIKRCSTVEGRRELRYRQKFMHRQQLQKLQTRQHDAEQERAVGFSRLVRQTERNEQKVIEGFNELLLTKSRMNEEFKSLIDTLKRDREITRDIRKRNYVHKGNIKERRSVSGYEETQDRSENTLQAMRVKSENERKLILLENSQLAEWYQTSVNKLALLAINGEDMTICHKLMNLVKRLLEDGHKTIKKQIIDLLEQIEADIYQKYNSTSLFCLELLSPVFNIQPQDIIHLKKYQSAKARF